MPQNWTSTITFTDYNEATIVNAMLESNGIRTVMNDNASISNYSEAFMHGSINIFVHNDDLEQAIALLTAKGYELGASETELERRIANFFLRLKNWFSFGKRN